MRLPAIAIAAGLQLSLSPQMLTAEPMGTTSRATVQIIASVAPRIAVASPTTVSDETQALCLTSNASEGSYAITAVNGEGTEISLESAEAALCHESGSLNGGSVLRLAGAPSVAAGQDGAPLLLMVAAQ